MFLYMILLPYAFLMNTSHNKKRVVEYGWSNVFKNLIRKPNNIVRDDINCPKSNVRLHHISTNLTHQEVGVHSSTNRPSNDVLATDFETSEMGIIISPDVSVSVEPCSSKGTSIPMVLNANKLKLKDEVSSVILIEQRFISKMREHIDDEPKYLEFFKDFVSFQDHCNQGRDPSQFEAEGEMSYYPTRKNQLKNPNFTRRINIHANLNKSKISSKSNAADSHNVQVSKKDRNADSNESERCKKENRTHLLECLRLYSRRDASYDSLKEQLINLEEEFINS